HNNKPITLDITQELSHKLELTSEDNFCVAQEVLTRAKEEEGITIDNEEEIFIQKSLTTNNLEEKGNNNQPEEKNQEQYLEQTLQAVNEEMIKNNQELINSKNQAKQLLRRLAIRRIELFALNRKLNARPNITQQQYNDLLQRPTLAEDEEITRLENEARNLKAERDARPANVTLDQ
ncbi:2390_t:CDS:2, partial [Ambispora leptoticha]